MYNIQTDNFIRKAIDAELLLSSQDLTDNSASIFPIAIRDTSDDINKILHVSYDDTFFDNILRLLYEGYNIGMVNLSSPVAKRTSNVISALVSDPTLDLTIAVASSTEMDKYINDKNKNSIVSSSVFNELINNGAKLILDESTQHQDIAKYKNLREMQSDIIKLNDDLYYSDQYSLLQEMDILGKQVVPFKRTYDCEYMFSTYANIMNAYYVLKDVTNDGIPKQIEKIITDTIDFWNIWTAQALFSFVSLKSLYGDRRYNNDDNTFTPHSILQAAVLLLHDINEIIYEGSKSSLQNEDEEIKYKLLPINPLITTFKEIQNYADTSTEIKNNIELLQENELSYKIDAIINGVPMEDVLA